MNFQVAALIGFFVFFQACLLNAQTPEEKYPRTYGNKGRAIQIGKKLPAWVTKRVGGCELSTKYKHGKDPNKPLVVVLCKELAVESEALFRALDSCALFAGFSVHVVVTDEKGIAADDDEEVFPISKYHSKPSFESFSNDLNHLLDQFQLTNTMLSVAVNRHLGDKHDSSVAVAYVFGTVKSLYEFDSLDIENRNVDQLLVDIGRVHRKGLDAQQDVSESSTNE